MASVFTPSLGTVHECRTSAAVTIIRTGEFVGSVIRLSVSSRRNAPLWYSSCGTMYESNSSFVKSEYSYLQYHWCPTALRVRAGLWISSIRYNSRRDGMAMNTKITAGAIVHIVSISCPSNMNRLVCLLRASIVIMYNTVVVIISIIISAWSWKKISCSMIGDALSCKPIVNHVDIGSNESPGLYRWSLNPMHLSATLDLFVS